MSPEQSAAATRRLIIEGRCPPDVFRQKLEGVDPLWRDDWLDWVLGTDDVPEDRELPTGAVPYLPAPVDALLRIVDHAPLRPDETIVDVGAGVGRAAFAFHLLTGARFVAVELQAHLCELAEDIRRQLRLDGEIRQADATVAVIRGDVQFLYCPFDAAALKRWLQTVEISNRDRVATVDIGLPADCGLVRDEHPWSDVRIYRKP